MKVLQFIAYLNPKRGGDINVCQNLSIELAKMGHEVTVLTTDFEFDDDYAINSFESYGIKVVSLPVVINLEQFLYTPSLKKWLKKNLNNFDIIHIHNYRSYQSNLIHSYAQKINIPYVIHAHGTIPRNVGKEPIKYYLRTIYDLIFGNKILRDSSLFIANSKAEKQYLLDVIGDENNIVLIYNGIESNFDIPKDGEFKSKYNISNNYLLFLGRIDKTKGIEFILNSYEKVLSEIDYSLDLVLIGPPGNYSETLYNIISKKKLKNLKIIDFLFGQDKLAAYNDAEIFLCTPNYKSGVLLTPLESILCSTPVIVTPEIDELFKDPDIGYIIPYGDIEKMSDTIISILNDPLISHKMLEVGQSFIKDNLNWFNVTKQVEKEYKKCLLNS